MDSYADLMFTTAVLAEQERNGSRGLYTRKYAERAGAEIDADTASFLESRTSLYLATVSETGWPYIQHRGGPHGFLKVLGDRTIGFADYRGNRQYISNGNLAGETRVSIFAMDYPRKARLKLQGHARMIDAGDDPDLAARLAIEGQGRVERLVTVRIAAFDWNCPQFITPRFDAQEIAALVAPEIGRLEARIAELEAENAGLKAASAV